MTAPSGPYMSVSENRDLKFRPPTQGSQDDAADEGTTIEAGRARATGVVDGLVGQDEVLKAAGYVEFNPELVQLNLIQRVRRRRCRLDGHQLAHRGIHRRRGER